MGTRLEEMLDEKNKPGGARLRNKALTEMGVYPNSFIVMPGGVGQIVSIGFMAVGSNLGEARISYREVSAEGVKPKTVRNEFDVLGIHFRVEYFVERAAEIVQVDHGEYRGVRGRSTTVAKH